MKLFPPLKEISITEIEGLRIGNAQDLDAMTGGFNLQIAWSTGHLAGDSIQ